MARYYFHICNGNGFTEDQEGMDLPDVDAARLAALRGARDVMAADVQSGELDLSSYLQVADERNDFLFTLLFQDALDLSKRHAPPPPDRDAA